MKEEKVKKSLYLNPVAQQFLQALQLIKVLIAGRGFGKSFDNGIDVANKVTALPRSKGLFLGVTYTQILTNTLLPMKSAWDWLGYFEGIHYVVGKKPPEWFVKPYQKPERYENVVTFWNGTTMVFGSFDRPQLLRGGSYDWVITDEALLIKKNEYDQIVQFSIRATHPVLKGKPYHLQESFTSSMPYGVLGAWLLDYEIKAKQQPQNYFYIEGTSWHNRVILGDETIKKWRRESEPLQYAVEVMNKRVRQFGNLFYPSLKERHFYTDDPNYTFIDSLEMRSHQRDSRWDKDCDPAKPINISHDWGAFNCITIDQEHKGEVRFINAMHVHHPDVIIDLAKKFCEYYKHHQKKIAYQWGDKSGNKREANSKLTYFEEFADVLERNGWRVIRKKVGDVEHLDRHLFISKLHREEDATQPKIRYNATNCKDLRIALESAPMKDARKDKRSENNPSVKPEHATHYTDAHDYRLYHAFANKSSHSEEAYKAEVR